MVPETGARFTCTSKMERKMLTRCPGRPSSCSGVTTMTRPSAGETTASGSCGMSRSGSRKKYSTKSPKSTKTAAKPSSHELAPKYIAQATAATAATMGPAANLYPSATIPGRPGRAHRYPEYIVPEDGGWGFEIGGWTKGVAPSNAWMRHRGVEGAEGWGWGTPPGVFLHKC